MLRHFRSCCCCRRRRRPCNNAYSHRLRDINSFDISSDSDVLDEVVITSSSEFHQFHGFLHPSMSSPITFYDIAAAAHHSNKSMPSTSNFGATSSCSPIAANDCNGGAGGGSNERKDECDNLTIPSTSPVAPISTFPNQLTTDLCTTSKNSKSRRMEYSMRGTKTCSSNSSCNPSQDSAFGSMTDGELSIASNSCRMSSFQSMSSPIDESVEDSIGLPGPSASLSRASTTSNNESIDISDFNASQSTQIANNPTDFNMVKKKSASFGTSSSNGLPLIEPPTILVNDGNSFYTTSPAKTFGTIQVFSQKYRVSSFEDMSSKRSFLRNVNKTNFRSLEEERRIDSAFTPVVKTVHANHRSFDASTRCNINNSEKFKKLTHVSFASKISTTRERHTVWKNSILARKNNLIKSNESLHDYNGSSSTTQVNSPKAMQSEIFYDTRLRKRVNSTNELSSMYRNDLDGANGSNGSSGVGGGSSNRLSTLSDDLKYFTRKSCSERYLLNMTMLRQTTIGATDCDECDEDESIGSASGSGSVSGSGSGSAHKSENDSCHDDTCSNSSNSAYSHHTLTNNSSTTPTKTLSSKTDNNSTDSSPSHRSMCKIIGGIDDSRHIEEKIPLLDGMEMSPISPVENNEML